MRPSLGLGVADKPDSQDICFVPDGRYADLILKLRPDGAEPGDIVDLEGRVLGRHEGIIHFTIGQRRGLGIAGGEPLYVVRIEAAARRVVVGPREALKQTDIRVSGLNWLGERPLGDEPQPVHARIRSARPPVPADIRLTDGGARGDASAAANMASPPARPACSMRARGRACGCWAADLSPGPETRSQAVVRDA